MKKILNRSGLFLASFLCSHFSVAQVVEDKAAAVNSNAHLTQVFVALLFVVGLIFLLAWFFKKIGHGSLVGGQHIKLVSNMPVGARERIALIEVGGKQILLGVTANQINTLHTFEEPVIDSPETRELSEFGKKIKDIIASGGSNQ